jgi:uncharacterized protein (DUF983 family)
MNIFVLTDTNLIKKALSCTCPRCNEGALFKSRYSYDLNETCATCGLDLTKNDSADGPAVLLIFVLGALLVPLALIVDAWIEPPLWVHAILWTIITLGLILGALKPLKSYIIGLQFKHSPQDWK